MNWRQRLQPIFTGFAPNLRGKELKLIGQYLFFPWKWSQWQNGAGETRLNQVLASYFNATSALSVDSGRSALYLALQALRVTKGDEVIIPGFTCVVVPNAVRWTGAVPIYVDINPDFNLNVDLLINKITVRTKAIIIQHTFGRSVDMERILALAKERGIAIIEDCAHALGARYQGRLLGTFGDYAIFSFGTDKIISCGRGGALISNRKNDEEKIRELKNNLPSFPRSQIFPILLHFPIFYFSKPLYHFFLGKLFLFLTKKLHLTMRIITDGEKRGERPKFIPCRLANCLAEIVLSQFSDLEKINQHRANIARYYDLHLSNSHLEKPEWDGESIWLRYPVLTNQPAQIHQYCRQKGIILGDWYNQPVAPKDISLEAAQYQLNSCPQAETLAKQVINLPTDLAITPIIAQRIVNTLNTYGD